MILRLREEIERLNKDSKLHVLLSLVSRLKAQKALTTRICVIADYVATLFYVGAEIENLGDHAQFLHGSMTFEDRQASIDRFLSADGILISSSAIAYEGVVLPDVTDLVLYDVPSNPTALQQILGRFDRFGRRGPLNVYALLPADEAFVRSSEFTNALHQLQETIASERGK